MTPCIYMLDSKKRRMCFQNRQTTYFDTSAFVVSENITWIGYFTVFNMVKKLDIFS